MGDELQGNDDPGSGHAENHDEDDRQPAMPGHQVALPAVLQTGTLNGFDAEGVRARALAYGTKAVAVSSNKQLTSKFRGVCWNKKNKRWQAAINSSGKYLYLGSYDTEAEAAAVFDKAAIRIRGLKARLNFCYSDYVDADGNIRHDAAIDELLSDAGNPGKPRRQRGSAVGPAAGGGGGEAAAPARPRAAPRAAASNQSGSEEHPAARSPAAAAAAGPGRGRRRWREADAEDADWTDGEAEQPRPRQRRALDSLPSVRAGAAARGGGSDNAGAAAGDSHAGTRDGPAPTGSALTAGAPGRSGASDGMGAVPDATPCTASSRENGGHVVHSGAGHASSAGAAAAAGGGARRSYGLSREGPEVPTASAAAAAAAATALAGAVAGRDAGVVGPGTLQGVDLPREPVELPGRQHARGGSAAHVLHPLEQLALAQKLSEAHSSAAADGMASMQPGTAAAAAAHRQAVRLAAGGLSSLAEQHHPQFTLLPDPVRFGSDPTGVAAAAHLQVRDDALAGELEALLASGAGGGGDLLSSFGSLHGHGGGGGGGSAGVLPLHGLSLRLSPMDQATLALTRLRNPTGGARSGNGVGPGTFGGSSRAGALNQFRLDDESQGALFALHQLGVRGGGGGAAGADELAKLLGGGGAGGGGASAGLQSSFQRASQLQAHLGPAGRGGGADLSAAEVRQAARLHSLAYPVQTYSAAAAAGGGSSADPRGHLGDPVRLSGISASQQHQQQQQQAPASGSVLQLQHSHSVSRPRLGPGGQLTLLLHPDPDSDVALTSMASAVGLSLRSGETGGGRGAFTDGGGGGLGSGGGRAGGGSYGTRMQAAVVELAGEGSAQLRQLQQRQQLQQHQSYGHQGGLATQQQQQHGSSRLDDAGARAGPGAGSFPKREAGPQEGHFPHHHHHHHQLQQQGQGQDPFRSVALSGAAARLGLLQANEAAHAAPSAAAQRGGYDTHASSAALPAAATAPGSAAGGAAGGGLPNAGTRGSAGGCGMAGAGSCKADGSSGAGGGAGAGGGGGGDVFAQISRALPAGAALEVVIPSRISNVVGVLYRTEAAAAAAAREDVPSGDIETCAAVWNGRVQRLRQLGSFSSEDKAKQSCQAALAILQDNELASAPAAASGPGGGTGGGGAANGHGAGAGAGAGTGGGGAPTAAGHAQGLHGAGQGQGQAGGVGGVGGGGGGGTGGGHGAMSFLRKVGSDGADGMGGGGELCDGGVGGGGGGALGLSDVLQLGQVGGSGSFDDRLVLTAARSGEGMYDAAAPVAGGHCPAYKLYMPSSADALSFSKLNGLQLLSEPDPSDDGQAQLFAIALPSQHAGNGAGGCGSALALDSFSYRLQPVLLGHVSSAPGGGGGFSLARGPSPTNAAANRFSLGLAAATAAAAHAQPDPSLPGPAGGGAGTADCSRASARTAGTNNTFRLHTSAGGGGGPSHAAMMVAMGLNAAEGELTDESAATDGPLCRQGSTTVSPLGMELAMAGSRNVAGPMGRGSLLRREPASAHGTEHHYAQEAADMEVTAALRGVGAAGAAAGDGGGGGGSLTSEFTALTQLANVDVQEALQLFFHQQQQQQQQQQQ